MAMMLRDRNWLKGSAILVLALFSLYLIGVSAITSNANPEQGNSSGDKKDDEDKSSTPTSSSSSTPTSSSSSTPTSSSSSTPSSSSSKSKPSSSPKKDKVKLEVGGSSTRDENGNQVAKQVNVSLGNDTLKVKVYQKEKDTTPGVPGGSTTERGGSIEIDLGWLGRQIKKGVNGILDLFSDTDDSGSCSNSNGAS